MKKVSIKGIILGAIATIVLDIGWKLGVEIRDTSPIS